jgi:hypothetical protein
MKTLLAVLFAAALGAILTSSPAFAEAPSKGEKLLRHVVLVKFKDSATAADVQKVTDAFAALPKKIDVIQDFEWGTDVGVENLSKGFTHCFLVTFRDAKGRDAYLPHPAHEEFKKLALPLVENVLVVDYWAKD